MSLINDFLGPEYNDDGGNLPMITTDPQSQLFILASILPDTSFILPELPPLPLPLPPQEITDDEMELMMVALNNGPGPQDATANTPSLPNIDYKISQKSQPAIGSDL